MSRQKIIVVSGYFNPLHRGHIKLLKAARKLGDRLIVILNSDLQVKLKGSVPFMDQWERKIILRELRCVDGVIISIDKDKTQCATLEMLKTTDPNVAVFANGGDRTLKNIPETGICKKLGIEMAFGVGGKKVQSSSQLLKRLK